MRKTIAAAALLLPFAFAGPANAAETVRLGVQGFMEQWAGHASRSGEDVEAEADGGLAQHSDAEVHIAGELEADNGLTFAVRVEFEGNTSDDQVDKSYLTVGGAYGQLVIGSEEDAQSSMHYGHRDFGVGLNDGDAGQWLGDDVVFGLNTNGVGASDQMISYYSPRVSGLQVGASYVPNAGIEDQNAAPASNDQSAWAVSANYRRDIGDLRFALSAGHYRAGQMGGPLATAGEQDALDEYADALADGVSGPTTYLADLAAVAEETNAAIKARGKRADDMTFTNVGLRVDVGDFGADLAYATVNGGAYVVDVDDPGNLVKDASKDYDVMSIGASYEDGPLGVSAGYALSQYDDESESSVTMASLQYALATGVASRSSIFRGEGTRGGSTVTGTGIVTGIVINF